MTSLADLKAAFRSDMSEAIGHCGCYDAVAILSWLAGRDAGLPGMGHDEDAFLARRTIEMAVLCVNDEQGDGTVPAEPTAGEIVSDWVAETLAEIEQAQGEGYGCWNQAQRAWA